MDFNSQISTVKINTSSKRTQIDKNKAPKNTGIINVFFRRGNSDSRMMMDDEDLVLLHRAEPTVVFDD